MCTFNESIIIKRMRNLIILKLKANGYIHVRYTFTSYEDDNKYSVRITKNKKKCTVV